jgi:hypothetical protein
MVAEGLYDRQAAFQRLTAFASIGCCGGFHIGHLLLFSVTENFFDFCRFALYAPEGRLP